MNEGFAPCFVLRDRSVPPWLSLLTLRTSVLSPSYTPPLCRCLSPSLALGCFWFSFAVTCSFFFLGFFSLPIGPLPSCCLRCRLFFSPLVVLCVTVAVYR